MSEEISREKLKEMAMLAAFSGRISEVHTKNLNVYPYIFFDGITHGTADYDLSKSATGMATNTMVYYSLEIDENAQNDHLDKRCQALENAVKTLLWKDVEVTISINGNIVSPKKDENV